MIPTRKEDNVWCASTVFSRSRFLSIWPISGKAVLLGPEIRQNQILRHSRADMNSTNCGKLCRIVTCLLSGGVFIIITPHIFPALQTHFSFTNCSVIGTEVSISWQRAMYDPCLYIWTKPVLTVSGLLFTEDVPPSCFKLPKFSFLDYKVLLHPHHSIM